ncbi:MAG: T9SS type A sorting domain-containing protein, partial [Bacteroidota bacterium]
ATFAINTYTLTPTAGANGTITPSTAQTVDHGDDLSFTITPDVGYHLVDVLVDGSSVGAVSSYNFLSISSDHTISATFAINTYTLSPTAGANGTITPATLQTVNHGDDLSFAVTPDAGYYIVDVLVDGSSVGAVSSYDFLSIESDHTISATFAINTYTLTPTAGANGTITPATTQTVNHGVDFSFTITPDAGYHIVNVLVDGSSVGAVPSISFFSISSDHTISATFAINTYTLTPTAGANGTITPATTQTVNHGDDLSFAVTPDAGYYIVDVLVDGASVGAVSSYNFPSISSDHTISASFAINTYTLTPTVGPNGTVTPATAQTANHGDNLGFTITADEGYQIWNVDVDGSSVGAVSEYTFTNVTADHSITVSFIKVIEVLSVSIPNATMRIGDVISATIEVITDAGTTYSLVSGSVGGYPLYGLQRINSTTYLANFNVIAGGAIYLPPEAIPVSNLVLTDGSVVSSPYDLPIIQNNDLLDGQLPVIESLSVEGGIKKIGDEVTINIDADGSGYSIHPDSWINGIAVTESNIYFDDLGGGFYRLRYYVQEGDNDVGYGELTGSIELIKPSGNANIPQTIIENTGEITIDAHPPVIARMEVPSIEVGPDQTVQVTIIADGAGYTFGSGTNANGVPLSSSRLTGIEHSGGLYELSYVVSTIDQNVSPGNLLVNLVMYDPAGNGSSPFSILQSNSLEVYTTRPTAVIAGIPEICEGEPVDLSLFLQGRGPWTFELSDGLEIARYESIQTSEILLVVTPLETAVYSINRVWDKNGVEGVGSNSLEILVYEKTPVEFVNLASGFSVTDDPVKLETNISGGTFSGTGVVNSTATFYPNIADTIDSPHTIFYTYMNENGCKSIDSAIVFVLGAEGDIFIPGSTICNDSEPFNVQASNVKGVNGAFKLFNENEQEVSGLTDHGDNSATVDPTLLSVGEYTIEYTYIDKISLSLSESFIVESVSIPEIISLKEAYCQNELPVAVITSVPGAIIDGPGISGNAQDGFMFDPGIANLGENTITSTFMSENGCSSMVRKSIVIKFVPKVDFTFNSACIPIEGGLVEFSNLSSDKLDVENWEWDFDDIQSGSENKSNLVNPTHFYQELGQRNISLTATTFNGCVALFELDTLIAELPVANLTWISDCFSDENGVGFINTSEFSSAEIDSSQWTFKTKNGQLLGTVSNSVISDTVSFRFPETDSYTIDLHIFNTAGCSDSITKELTLRPAINLAGDSYLENFNNHDGLWTIHSEGQVESWVWGEPGFNGLVADTGNRAWFTQLQPSVNGYKENSWIQSPCYDFTDMKRPLVQMDILKSFVPIINGTVLQYREGVDDGWKTLGADTPGIGWYNSDKILNAPGGSEDGWGLDVFNPDHEWVRAIHDLDMLKGKPHVTFRIALATSGAQGIGNEGFAMDNLFIADRSKITVLEYFTNSSDMQTRLTDQQVDSISIENSNDMIDIQYHMDYPGMDPMNVNNPFPASARSFYYGVPQVPYAILNGSNSDHYRFDFAVPDTGLERGQIKVATLVIPEIEIDLSVDWMEERLEVSTSLTCQIEEFSENIQLYIVVFETSVTSYTGGNGDTHFRNVVLDMLPTPAGKLIAEEWVLDHTISLDHSWVYADYVEDIEDLAVAVFIQDRNTSRIIQSACKRLNDPVSVEKSLEEVATLHIYPNPVRNSFHINIGRPADRGGRFELIDMNGRIVMIEQVPPGYQIYQLNIHHLINGMYILHWYEADRFRGMSKIVKFR